MERTTAEHAKKFGEKLSNIMYERHITQAQLAQELKVPRGTIYNWTHGLRLPRTAAMDALCRYLQISRVDLLEDDFTVHIQPAQAPTENISDDSLSLFLDSFDQVGLGDLKDLVKAAVGADKSSLLFVTEILKRNQKSNNKEEIRRKVERFSSNN